MRVRHLSEIYDSTYALIVVDPTSIEEAAGKEWCNAMNKEFMAIQKNETWELVDLPEGKQAIGLKWIIKTKYHVDESIKRYKARLVVKGYSQQQGIDFEDTFFLVA